MGLPRCSTCGCPTEERSGGQEAGGYEAARDYARAYAGAVSVFFLAVPDTVSLGAVAVVALAWATAVTW